MIKHREVVTFSSPHARRLAARARFPRLDVHWRVLAALEALMAESGEDVAITRNIDLTNMCASTREQVSKALTWLDTHNIIQIADRQARPLVIQVNDESQWIAKRAN